MCIIIIFDFTELQNNPPHHDLSVLVDVIKHCNIDLWVIDLWNTLYYT